MQANVKARADADEESDQLLDLLDKVCCVLNIKFLSNSFFGGTFTMERRTHRGHSVVDIANGRINQYQCTINDRVHHFCLCISLWYNLCIIILHRHRTRVLFYY